MQEDITILLNLLSKAPSFFWVGLLIVFVILAWRLSEISLWKRVCFRFGRQKNKAKWLPQPDEAEQSV
jgi:hypothetical protein